MVVQNGFDDLIINRDGEELPFSLSHLMDKSIEIPEFQLDSNHVVHLVVHMRPTNHLYSRKFDPDQDNYAALQATGKLLRRYEHHDGNFQAVTRERKLSSDIRVFCRVKHEASLLFQDFVEYMSQNLSDICVLPHAGNKKTCLSALMTLPDPHPGTNNYVVLFSLHKVNSKTINMLIETAFIATDDDWRVKLLTGGAQKDNAKPFLVLLRNVLAGRAPFEGKAKRSAKKGYKKKKKQRNSGA